METDEQRKDSPRKEVEKESGATGLTPSTADNASFEEGAGENSTGYDSPPVTSSSLSNREVHTGEYDPQGDDQEYDSESEDKDRHDSGRG